MKTIIIGATSGIGEELAKQLSEKGHTLGLASRNIEKLNSMKMELPGKVYVMELDISRPEEAMERFTALIDEMDGMDIAVISSGIGRFNTELLWKPEKETIDVNVTGFAAMAHTAYKYFESQKRGHLVGISSIAAFMGDNVAPAYGASKAFVTNYLEGLRKKACKAKMDIAVTDLVPGFVDTPMTKGQKGMFWVAPVEKAARQIIKAIEKRKMQACITKRWGLIAMIIRHLPKKLRTKI